MVMFCTELLFLLVLVVSVTAVRIPGALWRVLAVSQIFAVVLWYLPAKTAECNTSAVQHKCIKRPYSLHQHLIASYGSSEG